MNWPIYLFASGAAFFIAATLLLMGLFLLQFARRSTPRIASRLLLLIGAVVAVFSATAFPIWLHVTIGVCAIVWLVSECRPTGRMLRCKSATRCTLAVALLLAVAWEACYQFIPRCPIAPGETLYVVADSLTAGVDQSGVKTWPTLLATQHGLPVADHSGAGATTADASEQLIALSDDVTYVLLEIGGNDLLGETTPADFAKHVNQLLASVCRSGRTVVMFELPLPPLMNRFGQAQRAAAARHGVTLIPKRVLAAVIATDGATTDSLHLSATGQQKLADAVWTVIAPESEAE